MFRPEMEIAGGDRVLTKQEKEEIKERSPNVLDCHGRD
jgi:hypothetical protein